MLDPLFPSGSWTGFYVDAGCRFRQDIELQFDATGRIQGDGIDCAGRFIVDGSYCRDSLEASWTKAYPDARAVVYRGFREIHGIWGTWEIDGRRGGFHIWPRARGTEDAVGVPEEEQADTPVGVGPGGADGADDAPP